MHHTRAKSSSLAVVEERVTLLIVRIIRNGEAMVVVPQEEMDGTEVLILKVEKEELKVLAELVKVQVLSVKEVHRLLLISQVMLPLLAVAAGMAVVPLMELLAAEVEALVTSVVLLVLRCLAEYALVTDMQQLL